MVLAFRGTVTVRVGPDKLVEVGDGLEIVGVKDVVTRGLLVDGKIGIGTWVPMTTIVLALLTTWVA